VNGQAGLASDRVGLCRKEVTVCVVVTRGGSSDEQPTGCWPADLGSCRARQSARFWPVNGWAGRREKNLRPVLFCASNDRGPRCVRSARKALL